MARETNFDIGDLIRESAEFRNSDKVLVDPTTVATTIREPGGNKIDKVFGVDAEIVRDSAGKFHQDFTPTKDGTHDFRWVSTGTGQAAEETSFVVRIQKTAVA